jgi:endoplasmic reticulum protein 29
VKTGIWLGLPGRIKEFDELAHIFARNSGKDRLKVIKQTEELIQTLTKEDKLSSSAQMGKKYLKIMKILDTKGNAFLTGEEERIDKLLKDGGMSDEKKNDLHKSLNLLKSFVYTENKNNKRDEL